jgi:hypothetical protein
LDDDDRIKHLRDLIDEIVNLQDITQKLLDNITDQVRDPQDAPESEPPHAEHRHKPGST